MTKKQKVEKEHNLLKQKMDWYEFGKLAIISDLYHQIDSYDKDPLKLKEELLKYIKRNYKNYIPTFGTTKPTMYEEKFCYVETYTYKGIDVDIYDDDCGQELYFYYKDELYGCGTFNSDYKTVVEYVINKDLGE